MCPWCGCARVDRPRKRERGRDESSSSRTDLTSPTTNMLLSCFGYGVIMPARAVRSQPACQRGSRQRSGIRRSPARHRQRAGSPSHRTRVLLSTVAVTTPVLNSPKIYFPQRAEEQTLVAHTHPARPFLCRRVCNHLRVHGQTPRQVPRLTAKKDTASPLVRLACRRQAWCAPIVVTTNGKRKLT